MNKIFKTILIIYFSIFVVFFICSVIMEILRYIPFSKGPTFDLIWHIFIGATYITGSPLIVIFVIKYIMFLVNKLKK